MADAASIARGVVEVQVGGVQLLIRRLDSRAVLPRYQTEHAAGMDLAACLTEAEEAQGIVVRPAWKGGGVAMIRCGFAMALPDGFEAQVRPRSGLASRHGVTLPNAPGTIDADYRGEVIVPLINLGQADYIVRHGARVAQMVIARVERALIREVGELPGSQRGAGGFGSTGA